MRGAPGSLPRIPRWLFIGEAHRQHGPMHPATPSPQPRTQSLDATRTYVSDWVSKIEIARRLKVGQRKAAELVKLPYWPAPRELSPRILRWRWSEIEAALAERAPLRTERHEPQHLAAARERKAKAAV